MRKLLTCVAALSISCFAQSDGRALYQQAMNALSGSGVERSGYNAVNLMRRAAETGYAPAQTALGYWLQNGQYVAGSPGEAVDWYRRAAKQNDRFAEYALGRALVLGIGGPKDELQAAIWLKKAADAGDPFAKFYLALALESRDPRESVVWLKKVADDGIPQAFSKLGLALAEGRAAPAIPAPPTHGYSSRRCPEQTDWTNNCGCWKQSSAALSTTSALALATATMLFARSA